MVEEERSSLEEEAEEWEKNIRRGSRMGELMLVAGRGGGRGRPLGGKEGGKGDGRTRFARWAERKGSSRSGRERRTKAQAFCWEIWEIKLTPLCASEK